MVENDESLALLAALANEVGVIAELCQAIVKQLQDFEAKYEARVDALERQ